MERVNNQVLDILGNILMKNIDLSELGFITFTSVDVAPDLRTAKVYFSILNPNFNNKKIKIEINKRRKAFKKFMGPELAFKNIPDLTFYLDEKFIYEEKISKLLKETNYKKND